MPTAVEGTRITAAGQDKVEEFINMAYSSSLLVNGNDVVEYDIGKTRVRFERVWTVENDTPEVGSKRITVTVLGGETRPGQGFIGQRQELVLEFIKIQGLGGQSDGVATPI